MNVPTPICTPRYLGHPSPLDHRHALIHVSGHDMGQGHPHCQTPDLRPEILIRSQQDKKDFNGIYILFELITVVY